MKVFLTWNLFLPNKVIEPRCLLALYFALKATPTRWWVPHKHIILGWLQCRRLLEVRFGEKILYNGQKYTGMTNPVNHIEHCRATWEMSSRHEWANQFIHTLEMIPRKWYTSVELRWGTIEWEELAASFTHTFEFVDGHPSIDVSLQVSKTKIIQDILVSTKFFYQHSATV